MHSLDATLRDFMVKAWPVLILLAVLIFGERLTKPRYHRDEQAVVPRGIFPALFYITFGLIAVLMQGPIE